MNLLKKRAKKGAAAVPAVVTQFTVRVVITKIHSNHNFLRQSDPYSAIIPKSKGDSK